MQRQPQSFVQPAAKKIVLKPEAPSKAKKVTTAALAEQLAALSEALPSITSQLELLQTNQAKLETALNRPQVGSQAPHKLDFPLPSGGAAVDVRSFAQAVGPPPRTNFSTPLRHQARETLPEDEPMLDPQQDGFKPATPFASLAGAPTGTPGLHPAEPGYGSPCCPFDRQPRPYERSGIVELFKFWPLIKRGGKEGETSMRARKSIRQLHAVRGSECFQKDETDRPLTSSSSGFPRQIIVHSLLREAGRLPEPSRSGPDPMDASTHSRQSSCRRFEGSSGNDSSVYGFGRPGLPGQRKMGGSLLVEFAGRPPTGAVCSEGKADKSLGGCFLADLPPSLGDYNADFHQGDGHHQQSLLRSCWEKGSTKVRGRSRPAQSKTEAQVSKEAKARRMIHDGAHIGSQTCMLRRGALCSKARSCQGPPVPSTPLDAKTSHGDGGGQQSYWNSLQTFSFVRWCSGLLGDVLATSTPFASFLRSTLYASRSTVQAPEKALFPLPFPKLGIFAPLPSRCSSRMRRKFGFDRAFHVVIAALNFLYADCAFPPLEMLVRKPSIAQRRALWNLRSLFKAFGSSSDDFSVPKSGRRSTNLLASLCDLSEFLTRSGVASEAYRRGFEGEGDQGVVDQHLAPDLSRADELVPYRQLDPGRIRLSGSANWDPSPSPCDDLLLPFLEPQVLFGDVDFNYDDLPNLEREVPGDIVALWTSMACCSYVLMLSLPTSELPVCAVSTATRTSVKTGW